MESLLEQVFLSLPDGLFLFSKEEKLLHLNPAAQQLVGYSETQAKGLGFVSIFPFAEKLYPQFQRTLLTGHAYTIRENEFKNRLGENFVVEIHLEPTFDLKGEVLGASLLLRDLSEVKRMEEELRHADRLALMGTIASGLAHEIKNPLGGIRGAAQMLLREVNDKDLQEYLQIILNESARVNTLISELLELSKPRKIRFGAVNINKLLDELSNLEKNAREDPKIEWVTHFDPSLPGVYGDEGRLKQAFLNLIKNATESIRKKGTIELSTRLVTDYQFKVSKGKIGRMIEVGISDTGSGMSEETLSKLFAPFYTTKSYGTGLGLPITHRIVTEHQGFIQVESALNKGTTFRVFLRASGYGNSTS